jgi:maltose alpha-D-glucosyltransferase/alpha-amylase
VSSNTVVTLNETLFLKGYRHVREGINPELEMGRFLTEVARYPHCVPVLGALEYMTNDGRTMTLAMVQSYVANQGDGWDYTLGYLERFLRDVATTDGAHRRARGGSRCTAASSRSWPRWAGAPAELHKALATRTGAAAFDPEPLAAADLAGFKTHAASDATATLALLRERIELLPPGRAGRCPHLLDAAAALQAGIEARRFRAKAAASRAATTATTTWARCW